MAAQPSGHRTSSTRSNCPVAFPGAAPPVLAVRIDQVPGFVDQFRVFPQDDLGRGHAHFRLPVEDPQQRGQETGIRFRVVVEQRNEFAPPGRDPLVVGGAKPSIGRITDEPHWKCGLFYHFDGAVSGTVVHHNDFQIGVVLKRQGPETGAQ